MIKTRLTSFLEKHSILFPKQYGFRTKHSTTHAVLDITTYLLDNINDKIFSCLVMLDLLKAFDTVSHKRLLLKLEHYGIRGTALALLKSYLTNRMQFVNIDGFSSSLKEISIGVPLGSILGPLLYIINVNDFQYAVECTPRLYADDTCLLIQKSNLDDLQTAVDAEMDKISNWMVVNKLTINPKKSSILQFNHQ